MKTKREIKSLNKGLFVAILLSLISTVILTVFRFVHVTKFIDSKTGFFEGISKGAVIFFYALIAVFCIGIVTFSFLSSDAKKIDTIIFKNKALGVLSVLTAVCFAFGVISNLRVAISSAQNTGYADIGLLKQLLSSGSLSSVLTAVCALLSCIYFAFLSKSYFAGSDKVSSRKYLALSPVCFVAFRLLSLFVTKISFTVISDLLLEIISLCFLAAFFMAFAEVNSQIYSTGALKKVFGFGLCTASILISTNLPRFVLMFVNSGKFINPNYTFNVTDFILGIFILALTISAYKNRSELSNLECEVESEPKTTEDIQN